MLSPKITYLWRWLRVVGPAALFLPVILACPTRPLEKPLPISIYEEPDYFPLTLEKDVDLLFVIDNSGSMEQNQQNLSRNFPKLIEALRTSKLGGAIPNVHIGVVSSDLGAGTTTTHKTCENPNGDGGKLQSKPRKPGCVPPSEPWISYIEGKTNVPTTGTPDPIEQVKTAFQCIAELGAEGCGFEHQLEAARRALDPQRNANPGFLRSGAYLAVVIITDEDDCSAAKPQLFDPAEDVLGPATSFRCTEYGIQCDHNGRQPGPRKDCKPGLDWLTKVESYSEFFLKLNPGRTSLFVIAGPTTPFEVGLEGTRPVLKASCQAGQWTAVPAVRLKAVVDQMGKQAEFNPTGVNICSNDFGPALRSMGEKIVNRLNNCLGAPPLTSTGALACAAGDSVGGQTCTSSCLSDMDCVVQEVTGIGSTAEKRVTIEKCPSDLFAPAVKSCVDCTCWRVTSNPQECKPEKMGTPYRFEILRPASVEPAKGSIAEVRCAASLYKWGSAELATLKLCK
jgi:hypothetical protein